MSDVEESHRARIAELVEEGIRLEGLRSQARKESDAFYRALEKISVELRNIKAIRHLLRHDRTALAPNAEAIIDSAVTNALKIIDRAEIESDRIPF